MSEPTPEGGEQQDIKRRLSDRSIWMRGIFMLLFAVIYNIAEMVVTLVAVFQFLATLFTGSPNQRLLSFGETLSRYFYHVMRFLTFASDDRPFPFRDWPGRPEAPAGEDDTESTNEPEPPSNSG